MAVSSGWLKKQTCFCYVVTFEPPQRRRRLAKKTHDPSIYVASVNIAPVCRHTHLVIVPHSPGHPMRMRRTSRSALTARKCIGPEKHLGEGACIIVALAMLDTYTFAYGRYKA
jgi:hypothetical protein